MRLSRTSGEPLYRQVRAALLHRIDTAALGPGQRLPAESELAHEFGVHRLTVRRAVGELARLGRVQVRHGVGTFVATPLPMVDIAVGALTVDGAAARALSSSADQSWKVQEWLLGHGSHADPEAGASLGAPDGTLHRIQTLCTADGTPWILSGYWFDAARLPGLVEAIGESGDVFDVLQRRFAKRLHYAWRSFSATAATSDVADHLDLSVGAPLLVREGLNLDQHGDPVVHVRRLVRPDRARFVLRHDPAAAPGVRARPYPWPIRRGDGAPVQRDLRASDAERDAVVRRLERALRDGRLTIAEFDQRTQAVYAAQTRGELEDLTEDLPRDIW